MMRRLFLFALAAMATGGADELLEALNRFAGTYNAFIEEQRRGIFDVKRARELSQLWRKVERSGDWPS